MHRICQLFTIPKFVKTAERATFCGDPSTLRRCDYADQLGKYYPIHSPAATLMSAAFFFDKRASDTSDEARRVRARLLKQADFFNISQAVATIEKQAHELQDCSLAKLPDDQFAWVCKQGEQTTRHMPIRNSAEVKTAATWLAQYRQRFTFPARQKMAQRILRRAEQLGAVCDNADWLERQAGYGACTGKQAAELFRGRSRVIDDELITQALEKTASAMEQQQVVSAPQRTRAAATLDRLDREYSLQDRYSDAFPAPEDVLFGVTLTKTAAARQNFVRLTNGAIFDKTAFNSLRVYDVRQLMGALADEITNDGIHADSEKTAAIAPTLPRRDADAFQRMCRTLGVLPVTTKAAASPEGLTDEELMIWAAAYDADAMKPLAAVIS